MLSIILSTMMIMILVRYVLLERKELEFSIFANADHDDHFMMVNGDDHDGQDDHCEDHDDDDDHANGADHAIYDGVDKMTGEGGGCLPLSATDHPPVWFGRSALHSNEM